MSEQKSGSSASARSGSAPASPRRPWFSSCGMWTSRPAARTSRHDRAGAALSGAADHGCRRQARNAVGGADRRPVNPAGGGSAGRTAGQRGNAGNRPVNGGRSTQAAGNQQRVNAGQQRSTPGSRTVNAGQSQANARSIAGNRRGQSRVNAGQCGQRPVNAGNAGQRRSTRQCGQSPVIGGSSRQCGQQPVARSTPANAGQSPAKRGSIAGQRAVNRAGQRRCNRQRRQRRSSQRANQPGNAGQRRQRAVNRAGNRRAIGRATRGSIERHSRQRRKLTTAVQRMTQPPASCRRFAFGRRPRMLRRSLRLGEGIACALASCACCWRCCRSRQPPTRARSECRTSKRRISSSLLRFAELPRAARGAHVHQFARVAAPDVRLGAVRADDRPAEGSSPTTATRVALCRAAQHARLRRRAAVARVRDLSGQRAHVLADEPRDGPRGARRHCVRGGPALAPILPRQGRRPAAEPRIAALQLPDDPALHGAALVPGGRRGLHGDLDGRRPRPRAGRLRRDGVPGDGARRRPFLRSAGPRVARRPGRFPGRRECLSLRHALLHLARVHLFAREGRRLDQARRRQRALLLRPVPAGVRHSARAGLAGLDRVRARVPARNLAEVRKFPITPHRNLVGRRDRFGVAHVLRRGDRHPLRRLPLSRHRRVHRRAEHARRQRPAARRYQAGDALPGHVVRLRPRQRDRLLHQRQPGFFRCAT